jgi:hypothetical protein
MAEATTFDRRGRKIIGTGKNLAAAVKDAEQKLKAANAAIEKGRRP